MSLINNIQNALNERLSDIVNLPQIFWPNIANEPQKGVDWIRPTLIPANSQLSTLNNYDMHQGIYQIDIYTGLKKGTAPLFLLADAIRDDFKSVKSLTSGDDIIHLQAISISQAQRVESWWSCFVQINYLCFN